MRRQARHAHRRIWLVLGIALPLVVAVGLLIKQEPLGNRPAVQLEQPEAK